MQQTSRTPEEKEISTTIAVKKPEIQRVEKELLQLENQEGDEQVRRIWGLNESAPTMPLGL